MRSLGVHLRALSLDNVKIPINKTRLKIAVLKRNLGLPGANELTYWDRVKMTAYLPTTFSNSLYCIKIIVFWLKCPQNLFPWVQLAISQYMYWFRVWIVSKPGDNHYLNQWWPSLLMHYGRQEPKYSVQLMPCLLKTWWQYQWWHQQPWYCLG